MSNQVSLFRFSVGNDIYEIRLNVDKTLLTSLPPDASAEAKKRLITDIAQKHIKLTSEEIAPLLSTTVSDPTKMDLSTIDRTKSIIAFDDEVKTETRKVALEAIKAAHSEKARKAALGASSVSSLPEPSSMDELVTFWLNDPDIKAVEAGSPGDTPQEILMAKIAGLKTESLKKSKMEMIISNFSKSLSSLDAICDLCVSDWLYTIELLKKTDPRLSTNHALIKLIEKLQTNPKFQENLDFLIAIGGKLQAPTDKLETTFFRANLRSLLEESSKKEIAVHKSRLAGETGLSREFADNQELLTLRISDTHADFLNIIHRLLKKDVTELEPLKTLQTFEIKPHQGFEHDWKEINCQDFSAQNPFSKIPRSFKSTFSNFIKDYDYLLQTHQAYLRGDSTSPVELEIDDFKFTGRELNALFEGQKTPQEIHDLLYAMYMDKKVFHPVFSSIDEAKDYLKTNFAQIKTDRSLGKSHTFQLNQVFFSYDDFSEIFGLDACPDDAAIKEIIKRKSDEKYNILLEEFLKDNERNIPVIFHIGKSPQKTIIELEKTLKDASETVPEGTSDRQALIFQKKKEAFEEFLGITDLSLDKKYAAIELLFQSTPASCIDNGRYMIFSQANSSPRLSGLEAIDTSTSFSWNVHLVNTDDCLKAYLSFSYTPVTSADPMEFSDAILDFNLIRTINKSTGKVTDQLKVDQSLLQGTKYASLLEITRLSGELGLNTYSELFLP